VVTFLKHLLIFSLIIGSLFVLLTGCQRNEKQYYVVVVEGKEDMVDKFGKYASRKNRVIEIDYFKNQKDAEILLPDLKIEQTPVVFIFSDSEDNVRKLKLKTEDINQSLRFIKSFKTESK
jgi:predicted DNA-binding WGR domain protein